MKQVNNLKIRFNRDTDKHEAVAPDGRVLEEFDLAEDCVKWCEECHDFVVEKWKDTIDAHIEAYKTAGAIDPLNATIHNNTQNHEVRLLARKIVRSGAIDTAKMKIGDLIAIATYLVAEEKLSPAAKKEVSNIRNCV